MSDTQMEASLRRSNLEQETKINLAQADFFRKPKTKKEQLIEFIRQRVWCKSSDIVRWGVENYYIRADRTARELAEEGIIRRMPDDLKNFRFTNCKEDVWEWLG